MLEDKIFRYYAMFLKPFDIIHRNNQYVLTVMAHYASIQYYNPYLAQIFQYDSLQNTVNLFTCNANHCTSQQFHFFPKCTEEF